MVNNVAAQLARKAARSGKPVGLGPEFRDMTAPNPNDPWMAFRQYQIDEGVGA
jgi:hypothetical protein